MASTETGWNRTDRTVKCSKCDQKIHAPLNWCIPNVLSLQSLFKQLQLELRH
jgi:hypothetical protein